MKCAETTVIEKPVKNPTRKKQTPQGQQGQVPEVKQSAVVAAGQKPAVQEAQEAQTNKDVITLPMGLLGFEQVKRYSLLGSAEEAPFLWLQMAEDPNLAFLVVSPAAVVDSYQPDISDEEAAFLG